MKYLMSKHKNKTFLKVFCNREQPITYNGFSQKKNQKPITSTCLFHKENPVKSDLN